MAYPDRYRYRSSEPAPLSLPGLVVIIVLAIIALYIIYGHSGIIYREYDRGHPTDRIDEYQPTVGPDSYATR
jgi:hypothetical protein